MDALNFTAGITKERWGCRAAKGGVTIGGKFYKGGQFCPDSLSDDMVALMTCPASPLKPVKLMGSSRQTAWATRLRAEKLAIVEARMVAMLHEVGREKGIGVLVAAYQYKDLAATRQLLIEEPEAAVIIDAFAR